jgi:hypothetical protein
VGGRLYLDEEYRMLIVLYDKDGRKVNGLLISGPHVLGDHHEMSRAREQLDQEAIVGAIIFALVNVTSSHCAKLLEDVCGPWHGVQDEAWNFKLRHSILGPQVALPYSRANTYYICRSGFQ